MPSTGSPLPTWPRAHGQPLFQGLVKQSCGDFRVTELPGFRCTGNGEHDFLWLEKTDANTPWVARALARHAGVAARDVGYAGLKDRHAVTRQWFSVRRPAGCATDWSAFSLDGVSVLAVERHNRKLKIGAHRGNEFELTVRGLTASAAAVADRLELIGRRGVPNYFGSQRFGRDASNLRRADALFAGKRLQREQRSLALSAARSFLFNEILAGRVTDGSWDQALPGEALNLDQTASFFVVDSVDEALQTRLDALDIHPTGALWGRGEPACRDEAASRERAVVARQPALAAGLEAAGVDSGRRALRLSVSDLAWEIVADSLRLRFRLCRGGYATAVLREIVEAADG